VVQAKSMCWSPPHAGGPTGRRCSRAPGGRPCPLPTSPFRSRPRSRSAWIPPSHTPQIGEVQWPRQVSGGAGTHVVTPKANVIERPRALAWFRRTHQTVPQRRCGLHSRFQQPLRRRGLPFSADRARLLRAVGVDLVDLAPGAACSLKLRLAERGLFPGRPRAQAEGHRP
jgi:hypothetical protein